MKDIKLSQMPYVRPDKDSVIAKLNELIEKYKNSNTAEEELAILREYCAYMEDISTNFTLGEIRYSLNTKDEFYEKEVEYLEEIGPIVGFVDSEFKKLIVESKNRSELEKVFPQSFFKDIELQISITDEKLIPLQQEEAKITQEYMKLLAGITMEFNGETLNPAGIAKYATNLDRNLRKGAYETLGNEYMKIKDQLDDIYDRLVDVRTRQGKVLGYENYSKLGYANMGRICYGKEEIAAFRSNVLKYIVPLVAKIKAKIKEELGLDELRFYDDAMYSTKDTNPYGDIEEKFDAAQKMYDEMCPDASKLFRRMRECETFDVVTREGKSAGGYETGIPAYKIPFIFANFNGSNDDVSTFTHEFGHALNEYFNLQLEFYPLYQLKMETAECHSMSMEFLTYPWMKNFFKDRTDDFIYMHIASALSFIPYGTIVDAFQQYVYDNPSLSKEDRINYWKSLEKDFLPYMNNEGLPFYGDGRRWQRQQHIYESPFYYIDYCLAQFTAFQFLAESQKDYDAALKKYLTFSKLGPTKTYTELISLSGLKSPFEEDSFKEVISTIEKILKL